MDPLSVAASVASLATLVGSLISKGRAYGSGIHNAPKELAELIQELTYLKGVLGGLDAFLRIRAAATPVGSSEVLKGLVGQGGAVNDCRSALESITETLEKCERNPGAKRRKLNSTMSASGRLKWPLTKESTEDHIRRIERLKNTFILALSTDSLYGIDSIAKGVTTIAASLERERQIQDAERKRQKYYRTMDWLCAADMAAHHQIISQIKLPGTAPSCGFMPSVSNLKNIVDEDSDRSFLAGAGKTVLVSSVIDILQEIPKDRRGGLAYFYFDNKDSRKRDPRAMLGSLVGCLCAQNAEFMNEVQALSDKHTTDTIHEMLSLEVLQSLLLSSLKYHDTMTILIDALDECQNRAAILPWLSNLTVLSSERIRILASSRKEVDITIILESVPQIELDSSNMSTDINLMLHSCIKRRQRDNAQFLAQAEFQNQVTDALVDGAQGNFQWAKCQFDNLCLLADDGERSKFLDNLDLNLDQSYTRVFASIEFLPGWHSKFAKWLLPWMACSIRPMRYEELMEALNCSDVVLSKLLKNFGEPGEMLKMFRGLVQWNQETRIISFSHFSIKEFILSSRIDTTAAASYRVKEPNAHAKIAQSCLNIFLKGDAVDGVLLTEEKLQEALTAHPFLDYAAKSWIDHTKNGESSSILDASIVQLLTHLQTEENMAEYSNFDAWHQIDSYKKHWWSQFQTRPTETPFTIALRTERNEVVQELVDRGFHFRNTAYRVSLKTAASEGRDEIVRLLLDHGADPHETGTAGETALHLALSGNHISTAKILLEGSADPHFFDDPVIAGSAFSYAAEYASQDTMRFLLDYIDRVDIDRRGSHCGTALQKASSTGRKEIVSLLIDHGADVNANHSNYGTAIHQAAVSGHLNVVRFLLHKGADVNVASGDRGSALQAAINYGEVTIARFLIRQSTTDINLDTAPHGNALQQAASMEDEGSLAFALLQRGAVGDTECGRFRTALESAMIRPKSRLLRELMKRFPEKLNEGSNSSRVLQQAILSDQPAALAFLLENQAHVNVNDEFGWTPLICARHMRSDKALRTLEEYMPTVLTDTSLAGVIRPTRWDTVFFPENCRLDQDGLTIHYDCPAFDFGDGEDRYFFADAPFPPCTSSYFEITVLLQFSRYSVKMGLNEVHRSRYHPPSNYFCLTAFGSIYAHGKFPYKDNRPGFGVRDTVGCGYDWEKESIFFTLNGKTIPDSTVTDVRGKLFPTVEIKDDSAIVRANFGGRPFVYEPANTFDIYHCCAQQTVVRGNGCRSTE